jgi:hypothetical protein
MGLALASFDSHIDTHAMTCDFSFSLLSSASNSLTLLRR